MIDRIPSRSRLAAAALFCFLAAVLPLNVSAAAPWWYIWAPPGTHVGGPGAGVPGKLVVSPKETGSATTLSALRTNILNFFNVVNNFTGADGSNTKQQKVMQEAIGDRASGQDFTSPVAQVDTLTLLRRRQMIEELRAGPDADANAHFISYFEALQAHEARQRLYVERLNALIEAHKTPLNWQERVNLGAELGLLGAQQAISDQQLTEVHNRTVIKAASDKLEAALKELKRLQARRSARGMLP
jgi:parvulin-like peptidyl-prolyl isomerase